MKILLTEASMIQIRFDTGEDVLALLTNFCQENAITAASFSGLGAAGEVILAYYNLEAKHYEDHTLNEDVEILNLTGNAAVMDGKHIMHCHGVFGRKDTSTVGGHVKKLIVSATCEILLIKLAGTLTRAYDETTGLNLLQ
jgi:predicted DNA-binding protein with PD1-like motif